MISEDLFLQLVESVLNKNISTNEAQKEAIFAPLNENNFIVAGPGSGKTTVLVLKILKYIFVDGLKAENIILTTFTKKAANELKERTFTWFNQLNDSLDEKLSININKILIGTLDSIAEELLSKEVKFEVIDNFTSSAILMQSLLTNQRNKDKRLKQFIKRMRGVGVGSNTAVMNNQIQSIKERISYDLIDEKKLREDVDKEKILYDILDDYDSLLSDKKILDYPSLEYEFYNALNNDKLSFLNDLSVVLVDEYQDSNLLQEQIYFKLASIATDNGGSISVVGDDDQSLYRFRGASVSLFTNFSTRIKQQLTLNTTTIYLQKNYRSSCNIIDFTNEYVSLDDKYQKSRTKNKPPIVYSELSEDVFEVMGMFRDDVKELSGDLSKFIYALKSGNSYTVNREGRDYEISLDDKNPSIAVLLNSPNEIDASNKERLPFYIRESLKLLDENMTVFNPRGQNIENSDVISLICGFILLSIDKDNLLMEEMTNLPPRSKDTFNSWRIKSEIFIKENDIELIYYDGDIDLMELFNKIDDEVQDIVNETSENKIYHEILSNTIAQTNNALSSEGFLSTSQVFWHILVPIASGAIDLDEDIFDVDLKENVNIMSIHQAKGLEFDIVIVDVGSDIDRKSSYNAFKRFPKTGGNTYNIEQYLGDYSTLPKKTDISGVDESFDELIRKYFVAYTRSKSILLLVGLNSMRYGSKGDFQSNILIPNVATGWSRDEKWHWYQLDNLLQI